MPFGHDEVAIDEVGLQFRVCRRRDNQHLIDIRDDDVFAALTVARQHAMTGFDSFNHTLVVVTFRTEQNPIARNNNVAAVTSESPQNTSNSAFEFATVVGLNPTVQANKTCDSTLKATYPVNRAQQLITLVFDSHNSAATCERTFAGQSFAAACVFGGHLIVQHLMSDVLITSARLFIATQVNSNLAAFSSAFAFSFFPGHRCFMRQSDRRHAHAHPSGGSLVPRDGMSNVHGRGPEGASTSPASRGHARENRRRESQSHP